MNDISKRILKLFEDGGASYGEVADKTGIPKSALHRYATGETTKIPINRIEEIANYFKVSAAYIMGWEKEEPSLEKEKPPAEASDPQTEIFIKLLRKMTPEQKQKLADYMINLIAADNQ